MNAITRWLDDRTGLISFTRKLVFERIPGGARWRYTWGSVVLFAFFVQLVTGFFLWTAYSPSTQTAWESVYYIQHEMTLGWLLRGIHHYTAQMFIVLVALHLLQMVIDGAYRAPREINFWLALLILQLGVFFSITGWLLPWDQRGYYGSLIPTNLMLLMPGVGPYIRELAIGGQEYGTHHTLTRFFAFHVGLLPWLMIAAFFVRGILNRRNGHHYTEHPSKQRPDGLWWPDQILRNSVVCLTVLAVVLFLVLRPMMQGHAPGAELGQPADPSQKFSAARPETPFLWLFQMLKYFPGSNEVYGAYVVPGAAMLVMILMPLLGRWKLGRGFNTAFILGVALAVGVLTTLALLEDAKNPEYQLAVERNRMGGERTVVLAKAAGGIPPGGALALVRDDPYTQGPLLFKQHCASCHRYGGGDGIVGRVESKETPTAADLKGFASREWIAGLMDPAKVASPHYFGGTKFKDGDMVGYVKEDVAEFKAQEKAQLLKVIAALSAEAQLKSQRAVDRNDSAIIEEGRKLIEENDTMTCVTCHKFNGQGKSKAPDLTGYGSRQWLIEFVGNPAHKKFYGARNDRMPAFAEKKLLSERETGLIVDWLRGDWYEAGDVAESVPAATRPTTQTVLR